MNILNKEFWLWLYCSLVFQTVRDKKRRFNINPPRRDSTPTTTEHSSLSNAYKDIHCLAERRDWEEGVLEENEEVTGHTETKKYWERFVSIGIQLWSW